MVAALNKSGFTPTEEHLVGLYGGKNIMIIELNKMKLDREVTMNTIVKFYDTVDLRLGRISQ